MHRALPAALLLALAAGTSAACSSSTAPSVNTAASAAPSSAAASPSPDPEADACKVLAAMEFDASTMDASSKTQDQINAAMNLLPMHDALGVDVLAAEKDLVTLDIDLGGEQMGTSGYGEKYQTDAGTLQQALQKVANDCGAHGVSFTASVKTAS